MGNSKQNVNVLAGSHIPVLAKLLEHTDGTVIELGCGFNSTPFLWWMCGVDMRRFISYENDREWINKVGYRSYYTDDWDKAIENIQRSHDMVDIVLVDHRPARKRRSSALKFKNHAKFVVLHDSELADHPAYKYTPIYKHFKYQYEYTKTTPHTMILSNFIDPQPLFDS